MTGTAGEKNESPFDIVERARLNTAKGGRNPLGLFHGGSLGAANGLCQLHPLFDGRLREEGTLLDFLQNARTFVLLLETAYGAVDGLILTDNNANQEIHLLRVLTKLMEQTVDSILQLFQK